MPDFTVNLVAYNNIVESTALMFVAFNTYVCITDVS